MRSLSLLIAFLIAGGLPLTLRAAVDPIAFYRFEGDGRDEMGKQSPMDLDFNPVFMDGAVSLLGDSLLGVHAIAATPKLTGFSYESFTVSLDFNAKDFGPYHVSILCGGYAGWMSLAPSGSGRLALTINDALPGNGREYCEFTNVVTTGKWHTLICSIDWPSKKATVYFDGLKLPVYDL